MAEYPQTLIPLSDKPLTFVQAAVWYLRFKLMIDQGVGKHTCPVCGGELHFRNGEVAGVNSYLNWITVGCPNCRVSSDRFEYPRYNYSPVELANCQIQKALEECCRRLKR